MHRLLALPILIGAAAPALADRALDAASFQQYARARAADAVGNLDVAAAGYAAALAARPDDAVLATRAYRQAISAGERGLALQAVRTLEAQTLLPPDGPLLLLTEAVTARKWKEAHALADRVAQEGAFSFMVPALHAWIAFGARDSDPAAWLDRADGGALASAYAPEHRALLAFARRQYDDGNAALLAAEGGGGGSARLRLAAAATLARHGRRDEALALLTGTDPVLAVARGQISARRPLHGAVDTAAAGIAQLFSRVAIDINRERVTPLALTLARLATFLDPQNGVAWLVTSEMLASSESVDAAIAVLDRVGPNDPFRDRARQNRLDLLVRKGERQVALIEAERAVKAPGATLSDWRRLGDSYADAERHADAAIAYGRALELARADPAAADQRWLILLQYGVELSRTDRWPEGKAALEEAAALAPEQAVVLNFLGYVQLERRENLKEAEALIRKASELKPDDAAITDSLGWAHFLQGNLPKATELLERAVTGEPGDPTINEHLGDVYWHAGRRLEARYAWRAALVHAEDKDSGRIRDKIDAGLSQATAAP